MRLLLHLLSLKTLSIFFAGLFLVSLGACKKHKYDFSYDNNPDTYTESQVRLINLGLYRQVYQEGKPLTNTLSNGVPTPYFPEGGLLGRIWSLPEKIFDGSGEVHLELSEMYEATPSIPTSAYSLNMTLSRQEGPRDYFTLWPRGAGQPAVVGLPRDIQPATQADHIKIRLINLSKALPPPPVPGKTGPMENLNGPLTLTYADGTPVDAKTSNISPEQQNSPYVEIPYGTYQFKVLTGDGRQLAATVHGVNAETSLDRPMDPASSRMLKPDGTGTVTELTYAPIRTYQPGGVYSIVVAPFPFLYRPANYFEAAYQNQFKVLEDIPAPANANFSKVQCVNTLAGEQVLFKVNGESVGQALDFGSASAYHILPAGQDYHIEAFNASETLLASLDYPIQAAQNHTVWLWRTPAGKVELLPVSNDLSAEFYVDRFDDNASQNRYENTMTLSTRFLNLSAGLPYLSFTINDGQDMRDYMQLYDGGMGHIVPHSDAAVYNLQPGIPITDLPYVRWRVDYGMDFKWLAYRSKPGVVPGQWAEDIPPLRGSDLIANPELYTLHGRDLPASEPGIYTIVLAGSAASGTPGDQRARMLVIKHNQ